MPTLTEAARLLRISEKTLRKWMQRLQLEPTRHAYDYRYYELTDEQVEAIRSARAAMPEATISIASLPAFDRRSSVEGDRHVLNRRGDVSAPTPRPRQPHTAGFVAEGLPEGLMSKKEAADRHGLPPETVRGWCRAGKVETDPGTYRLPHGRWPVVAPITRKGLAQLIELASPRSDFVPCAECPHVEQREE